MRVKLKEKALAKLDDESYFIKRHKKYLAIHQILK